MKSEKQEENLRNITNFQHLSFRQNPCKRDDCKLNLQKHREP